MPHPILLLTLLTLFFNPSNTNEIKQWGQASNKFALDLYKEILKDGPPDENVFFSPFSTTAALSMTLLGAGGNTKTQMSTVMHLNALQNPHATFEDLDRQIREGSGTLSVANRLFGNQNYQFQADFINDTQNFYGAGLETVDFSKAEAARQHINQWVESQTNDKIKELIKPNLLSPAVVLVLTNAIHFEANWTQAFEQSKTSDGKFHNGVRYAMVPMMRSVTTLPYASVDGLNCDLVELPYKGDDYSMYVLLPRRDVAALTEELTQEKLDAAINSLQPKLMDFKMPKFEVTQSVELKPILKGLGMTDVFSNQANLSRIADGIFVSDVEHKAFIKLNEYGTEAAAATAVVTREFAAQEPQTDFKVTLDKPFLHLIRHKPSDSIIFMGKVHEPMTSLTWKACVDDCPKAGAYSQCNVISVSFYTILLSVIYVIISTLL